MGPSSSPPAAWSGRDLAERAAAWAMLIATVRSHGRTAPTSRIACPLRTKAVATSCKRSSRSAHLGMYARRTPATQRRFSSQRRSIAARSPSTAAASWKGMESRAASSANASFGRGPSPPGVWSCAVLNRHSKRGDAPRGDLRRPVRRRSCTDGARGRFGRQSNQTPNEHGRGVAVGCAFLGESAIARIVIAIWLVDVRHVRAAADGRNPRTAWPMHTPACPSGSISRISAAA